MIGIYFSYISSQEYQELLLKYQIQALANRSNYTLTLIKIKGPIRNDLMITLWPLYDRLLRQSPEARNLFTEF